MPTFASHVETSVAVTTAGHLTTMLLIAARDLPRATAAIGLAGEAWLAEPGVERVANRFARQVGTHRRGLLQRVRRLLGGPRREDSAP